MNPSDSPKRNEHDARIDRPLPCEEIQALMLDYMQHDLGEGRSDGLGAIGPGERADLQSELHEPQSSEDCR